MSPLTAEAVVMDDVVENATPVAEAPQAMHVLGFIQRIWSSASDKARYRAKRGHNIQYEVPYTCAIHIPQGTNERRDFERYASERPDLVTLTSAGMALQLMEGWTVIASNPLDAPYEWNVGKPVVLVTIFGEDGNVQFRVKSNGRVRFEHHRMTRPLSKLMRPIERL